MPPALVIGYGNCLRSDDGAGRYAAQQLAVRLPAQIATVLETHQLLPEMAQLVSQAQLVVLIDAALGSPAGLIQQQRIEPDESAGLAASVFGHHLSAAQLMAAAKRLYGRCPETMLFTVNGQSFDMGDVCSQPVVEALPLLVDQVEKLVRTTISLKSS